MEHIGVGSKFRLSDQGKESRGTLSVRWREMNHIVASLMMALVLSASALGLACDLSCGFAPDKSDCHTSQAQGQESAPATVKMGDMPGMAMPQIGGSTLSKDEMVSSAAQGMPVHPSLVDMNTCERHPCDQGQLAAAQANRSTTTHCDVNIAIAGFSYPSAFQASFHNARDDLAPRNPTLQSPPAISLRI